MENIRYETKATTLTTRGIFADGKLTGVYLSGKGLAGDEFSVQVDGNVLEKALKSHIQKLLDQRLAGIENLVKAVRKEREAHLNEMFTLDASLLAEIRKAVTTVEGAVPIDGDKAQLRIEETAEAR